MTNITWGGRSHASTSLFSFNIKDVSKCKFKWYIRITSFLKRQLSCYKWRWISPWCPVAVRDGIVKRCCWHRAVSLDQEEFCFNSSHAHTSDNLIQQRISPSKLYEREKHLKQHKALCGELTKTPVLLLEVRLRRFIYVLTFISVSSLGWVKGS